MRKESKHNSQTTREERERRRKEQRNYKTARNRLTKWQ